MLVDRVRRVPTTPLLVTCADARAYPDLETVMIIIIMITISNKTTTTTTNNNNDNTY